MTAWFVYYNTEFYPWAEIVQAEKALDAVRYPEEPFVIARADRLAYPPDLAVAKKIHSDLVQQGQA